MARSRSESESEMGDESRAADPKPGDLPLARMKREYNYVEVRTHQR
jgi:hypothetical protein